MTEKTLLQGFHHIALRALDFEATVRFYTEGLGMTQTIAWGEGDGRIVMLDAGNGNCVEVFAGGDALRPEGCFMHLAFVTDDVDTAFQRAIAAGAKEHIAPKSLTIDSTPAPTPVRLAFCIGLNGEVIEFFHQQG